MSAWTEVIADSAEWTQEALGVLDRFEPLQDPLALAGRQVSYLEQHLVQMPLVARLRSASAQVGRVARPECVAPVPDGLVADDDPALGEEFLDVPKAERKAEVEPDGVGDHLGRESVATVWGP